MLNKEWPAKNYAVGAYIQALISDDYTRDLQLKPNDDVLDIGCGDGSYSTRIIEKIPKGSFVGIDTSQNMLDIARQTLTHYANVILQENDVTQMAFIDQFDCIVSFWCLQWTSDIVLAFKSMIKALRKGGQVLTVFAMGDDPFTQIYKIVKKSGEFPELAHFKSPIDYSQFEGLDKRLALIPFKRFELTLCEQQFPPAH